MSENGKNIFSKTGSFFIVPSVVLQKLKTANEGEIKVALYMSAYPDAAVADAALATGLDKAEVQNALAFWRGADSEETVNTENAVPVGQCPSYDGSQLAEIKKSCKSLDNILNECQKLVGKTFSAHEEEIYIGSLYDWLGLSPEYILALTSYCCEKGKNNVRYIEKTAVSLTQQGIDTFEKLEIYIKDCEKNSRTEYRLRKLFGFGERALTATEKKHFAKYCETPFELVEYAYEQMIKNVGSVKLNYMSKILDNWQQKGITTVSQAQSESDTGKPTASKDNFSSSSFDFDDFLDAAIKNGLKKSKKG